MYLRALQWTLGHGARPWENLLDEEKKGWEKELEVRGLVTLRYTGAHEIIVDGLSKTPKTDFSRSIINPFWDLFQ